VKTETLAGGVGQGQSGKKLFGTKKFTGFFLKKDSIIRKRQMICFHSILVNLMDTL